MQSMPGRINGCGFTGRRVCVFDPSSNARTIGAENKIGSSFIARSCWHDRLMPGQTTFEHSGPLGKLRLTHYRLVWRLYANEELIGSFPTAEEAVRAVPAEWKAPVDLNDWGMSMR